MIRVSERLPINRGHRLTKTTVTLLNNFGKRLDSKAIALPPNV